MFSELVRITYVEDEVDIREVTEMALTEVGGFEVDCCASGPEALERIPQFKPQLVVLDVMMPGMDGPEVLRRLGEIPELRDLPIIFMTAKTRKDEIAHFLSIGAIAVIPKPFDPFKLPSDVRTIWHSRRLQAVRG